jgi:hypothetical protein
MTRERRNLRQRGVAALSALALAGGLGVAGASAATAAPAEDEITLTVPLTSDAVTTAETNWEVRFKDDSVPYLKVRHFEAKCPPSHPWLMMNKPGTLEKNELAPDRQNPGGVQVIEHPRRVEVSTYEHPAWRQEMYGVGPGGKEGKYYAVQGVKGDYMTWLVGSAPAIAVYLQCTNDPWTGGAVNPADQSIGVPS